MLEQQFNKADQLVMQVKTYVSTEIELIKLTIAQKASKIFSELITGVIVVIVLFLFLLFGSFALAYFIGQWLDNTGLGFLIVAGLYLLIGIIAWSARETLFRTPIMNAIVRNIFSKEEKADINSLPEN